jgi:creatinine amidohydrolase/Fe(II)-dependent formamide hydrolase-like protein
MGRIASLTEDMTWPELKAMADAGTPVALSAGSAELHGPHLPISIGDKQAAGKRFLQVAAERLVEAITTEFGTG